MKPRTRLRTCFFAIIMALFAIAQGQQNPFELNWRTPTSTNTIEESSTPSNPFEVVPHKVPTSANTSLELPKTTQHDFISKLRFGKEPKSFLFWVIFGILGYLAFAVVVSRGAITKAWNAFLNPNQFILLFRDWLTNQLFLPFMLLYGNFILNAGLFLYMAVRIIRNKAIGGLWMFVFCVLAVLLSILVKHIFIWTAGSIYPVKEQAQKYNFLICSANISLGLFLIPFNLLIAFVPEIDGFLVFWVISLFGILYALRSFRALSFGGSVFASDKFHFLLYLCTLEILPILLLGKVIVTQVL